MRAAVALERDRTATVLDVGAGTGHHLAAVLGALPEAHGIAFGASSAALRRAGRAHPRIAAVAGDVWREIPLLDATADLVTNVFAPRNLHLFRQAGPVAPSAQTPGTLNTTMMEPLIATVAATVSHASRYAPQREPPVRR